MAAFITTAELATWLRTKEETLRSWRHQGMGPPWIRVGRKVLYDQADVEQWLSEQKEA